MDGDKAIIREGCAVAQATRVGYDGAAHYAGDCDSTALTGYDGVAHFTGGSDSTVFRGYDRTARFAGASVVFSAGVRRNSQLIDTAEEREDETCRRVRQGVKALDWQARAAPSKGQS